MYLSERIRLDALNRVKRKELTVVAAAELAALSLRQMRRVWKRVQVGWRRRAGASVARSCGKPPIEPGKAGAGGEAASGEVCRLRSHAGGTRQHKKAPHRPKPFLSTPVAERTRAAPDLAALLKTRSPIRGGSPERRRRGAAITHFRESTVPSAD